MLNINREAELQDKNIEEDTQILQGRITHVVEECIPVKNVEGGKTKKPEQNLP